MTIANKPSPKRRDLRAAAIAALLLIACGSLWLWTSNDARERREAALSSVPDFPARGQPAAHARRQPAQAPRLPPPALARLDAGPPLHETSRPDAMTSFVLHPSHTVGVINVNALLNTPLFAKIKECMPLEFEKMEESASKLGFDFERDVDRIALVEGGMAMSGFFAGKPVAESIIAATESRASTETWRGVTIHSVGRFAIAQIGNLIVSGSPGDNIRSLVDRAIDPPPAAADPQDVYGDIFMRTDLEAMRGDKRGAGSPNNDAVSAMLDSLGGLTARANVWDSVALSLEGKPRGSASVGELASMARGAIQLARDQVDQEEVELSTLADLARVSAAGNELHVDLALPAKDLFEKLHFPCPGRNEPAQPRRSPAPNVPPQN